MLLLVHDWWLHVNILELSVLRTRTFSREELLLVCMSSLLDFTSFWGWTLWFCKVLSSLERFRSMSGLDFNFIRMAFLMMSDWVLLLLKKHRLLLLSNQELLLVVGTVLALPELLVFQTQTKAIATRHLSLASMHWTQLLLAHVRWLGQRIVVTLVDTRYYWTRVWSICMEVRSTKCGMRMIVQSLVLWVHMRL